MRYRRPLLASLAVAGTVCAGLLWLGGSNAGLQALTRLASGASGERLRIDAVDGRLLGPLRLGTVRWTTPDVQIAIDQLQLDWSPGALLHGKLRIVELKIGKLRVDSAGRTAETPPPATLRLPLTVDLKKLHISRLEIGPAIALDDLHGRLHSTGEQHRLSDFQARSGRLALRGEASLGGNAPLPLSARLAADGQLEQHPLALTLHASGPLARLALSAEASKGIQGSAHAVLTPFAETPLASAHFALDDIDPATWQPGAPAARLALRADIRPADGGLAGHIALSNRQPGPLDKNRLPLARLDGRLDWRGERLKIAGLTARLAGTGQLHGDADWQDGALRLDLAASQLDAAQLHSALRSTRLNGPISATLGSDRQNIRLDLQDAAFKLQAEASHAAAQITVHRLLLVAGRAHLSAHGELGLDAGQAFSIDGELRQFDPSRFARLPAARIDASFGAHGRLAPLPRCEAQFVLQDSRLAGQPLSGQGSFKIDWPRLPRADLQVALGPNRLAARGAFGGPGDTLAVELDAPQLAPYGLEGGASGRIELAGTPRVPHLTAHLQAARLGRPGVFRLTGLTLQARAGGEPGSPLHIDLALAGLATADQPALAKQLSLQASGSNRIQHWQASAELAGRHRLQLAATGGLLGEIGDFNWRGQLLQAELSGADSARGLRLNAPAALHMAPQRWRLGPATLSGMPDNWQLGLQAEADNSQLRARLDARGPRIGRLDGQLQAGLHGAWALDRQAPWLGKLNLDLADLGWLPEVIGEAWQSAGQVGGSLQLAGTPARPLANGRLRGEKLALRLPEQGLHLANGDLDIDLQDNRLRVRRFAFDSLLHAAPRPLLLADREALAKLGERPGRLEITGEMQVDRGNFAEQALLDVHLDRLGLFQRPDQWVALSGDGRLSWQDGTLGARGRLAVDAGYWQLAPNSAPRLSDDVAIKRAGAPPASGGLRPRLDLDITTELGQRFLFSGAGLSARLAGDIRLRASGRDLPRASGSIRARDGRFDAYGQQLAIERGILTFQGLPDNPGLDVRAVRQGLAVEPGVHIGGTAQRPVIRLISDPELPDTEKLAWLVLGHGSEQMSGSDATVLLSAADGLLGNDAGGLLRQLKKGFGVDEFGIRQGGLGDTGSRGQSSRIVGNGIDTTASTGNQILSIGKRLSSNALLSYEQALGKAESIVKLTVNLNRQVALIGRAGSDNALDVFYTLTLGRSTAPGRGAKFPDRESP